MPTNRYDVTYAFDERAREKHVDPIDIITATVSRMQHDNIEIDFGGAIQEVNASGELVEVTARYIAPTKGTIGRCNCRTRLPASGPPKLGRDSTPPAEQSGPTRSPTV